MPSPKMQDDDAYSDSGSTISLASCGSGEFSARPPQDGSVRPKSVKGRHSRLSNKAPSPYASRQQPPKRREPTKPSAQNLWMSAMKNGAGALSTNSTAMDTWAGGRPPHANKRRPGSGKTKKFSDTVELTNGKTKSLSRSATLSYSQPVASSGGPALKPAEDYYDDIIELKKIINSLKEENNRVNTKLHRVEEENVIKDRRIEDLLNSRKQPEDLRRTLTDKRADSSSIVTSLKQKLHAVERTVKEKETELNKLKRDLKTTDVEELNIQSEVYYQEVQRLQLALLEMQQDRINEVYAEDSFQSSRAKSPVSPSQEKLQKDIELLKAENKSLKKELISAVENLSTENRKPLNVDYADMTRGQLLQTIHELQTRAEDSELRSSAGKDKEELEERNKSKKKRSRDRKSSTASAASVAEDKEAELLEENEKQRKIIEKLKDDRTHYRLVADDLRKQLTAREAELEELQLQLSKQADRAGGPSARKASVISTSSVRKQSITARERDEFMEKEFEEFQQRHAAKVLQKQWRTYRGNKNERVALQQAEEEKAAKTLQRGWRQHMNSREAEVQNEAITDIQAAFRGHLARKERLDNLQEDVIDSDDAIVNVQSAFRGHLTRTKARDESGDDQRLHGRSRDSLRRVENELSDEDSDDDLVIGGKATPATAYRKTSGSEKSPFSAKKRSSFTEYPDANPPQPLSRTKHPTPQPAPRTLKRPPPPSPTPRKRTPPVHHNDDDDDDSDDDVVIGGSPEALRGTAPQANQTKPSHAQSQRFQSSKASKSRIETSEEQLDDNVFSEPDSDSDNELVVCGKSSRPKTSVVGSAKHQEKTPQDSTGQESSRVQKVDGRQKVDETVTMVKGRCDKGREIPRQDNGIPQEPLLKRGHVVEDTECTKVLWEGSKDQHKSLKNTSGSIISASKRKTKNLICSDVSEVTNQIPLSMTEVANQIPSKVTELTNEIPSRVSVVTDNISPKLRTGTNEVQSTMTETTTHIPDRVSTNRIASYVADVSNDAPSKATTNSNPLSEIKDSSTKATDVKTGKSVSVTSSLGSTTSKPGPDLLANENPFIALANGKTALQKNKFFSGIEWIKPRPGGSTSSHKKTPRDNKSSVKSRDTSKGTKQEMTCGHVDGLTKNFNPQRTIDEATDESEDGIVSSHKKTSSHVVTSRGQRAKPSRHEIIDSDEDEDDVVLPTKTTTKSPRDKTSTGRPNHDGYRKTGSHAPTKVKKSAQQYFEESDSNEDEIVTSSKPRKTSTGRPSHDTSRKTRTQAPVKDKKSKTHQYLEESGSEEEETVTTSKPRKTSTGRSNHDTSRKTRTQAPVKDKKSKTHQYLEESGSDEDEIVTSSKSGKRSSQRSSSKYNKNTPSSSPKRPSLVESLLSSKSSFRSSEDNRIRSKAVVQNDDDDDDDDDDMVINSFRKSSFKSRPSVTKEKDSLASLWSDPKPQEKNSFGFSSFGDNSSSNRRGNASFDELF